MSDMNLSILVGAKADSAKTELAATAAAVKDVGAAAAAAGTQTTDLTGKMVGLESAEQAVASAAKETAAGIKLISDAQVAARTTTAANTEAVSLNRIQMMEAMHITREWGTMMAMGVDPMRAFTMEAGRIATFFQMGDAGAIATAKGLGSAIYSATGAVVGFLGPVGLAVLGITALAGGGIALYEAFKPAIPTTEELVKQVKALDGSISGAEASMKLALTPIDKLKKEFHDGADEARRMYDEMVKIDQQAAQQAISKTTSDVISHFSPMTSSVDLYSNLMSRSASTPQADRAVSLREDAALVASNLQKTFGISIQAADQLKAHLDALSTSTGLNTQAMALEKIAKDLREAAAQATGPMAESLNKQAQATAQAAIDAQKLAGGLGDSANAARDLGNVDATAGIKAATAAARELLGVLTAAQSAITASDLALNIAQIKQHYGKDKSGAAGAVAGVQYDAAMNAKMKGLSVDDRKALAPQLSSDRAKIVSQASQTAGIDAQIAASTKTGNAGATSAKTEQEAVDKLLRSLQAEIDARHTLDPVQKEMLKYREVLAKATDTQTAAIKAKIIQDMADAKAMDAAKQKQDLFTSSAYDALDSLIVKGSSFADVMKNVASAIEQAVLKAALLGTGPLASLMGTSSGGGFLTEIAKAIFPGPTATGTSLPAKAGGGMIYGPGSSTSDSVLMWGSNGEMVMNGAATQRHRHLLEAMNSGADIPGFASGGIIAPSYVRGPAAMPAANSGSTIIIENHSSAQITGTAQDSTDSSGRRTTRFVMADAVGDAMTTRGGGAQKTLRNGYGLQKVGAKR